MQTSTTIHGFPADTRARAMIRALEWARDYDGYPDPLTERGILHLAMWAAGGGGR